MHDLEAGMYQKIQDGDKVICIKSRSPRLKQGKEYTVQMSKTSSPFVYLEGVVGGWYKDRFIKSESFVKMPYLPVSKVKKYKNLYIQKLVRELPFVEYRMIRIGEDE